MTGDPNSRGRPAGQLGSVDHAHKTEEGPALLLGVRNWIRLESQACVRRKLAEAGTGGQAPFLLPLSKFRFTPKQAG